MLYFQTINEKLHRLLIAIQGDFPNVRLVGGTALALQYGHRESIEQGMTLASDKDIAAMKIAAITGRGSKKDFVDLYFLLTHYTIGEILEMYENKYPEASLYLALKSLTFFEDADIQPNPKMFSDIQWGAVKNKIRSVANEYISNA